MVSGGFRRDVALHPNETIFVRQAFFLRFPLPPNQSLSLALSRSFHFVARKISTTTARRRAHLNIEAMMMCTHNTRQKEPSCPTQIYNIIIYYSYLYIGRYLLQSPARYADTHTLRVCKVDGLFFCCSYVCTRKKEILISAFYDKYIDRLL